MSPISLTAVLLVALGLRIGFLCCHLADPSALWSDYERRGLKFRLAQWLDFITLTSFTILTIVLLYQIWTLEAPLATTFVGFLGIQLLSRLKASRFPRTNVAGAFEEAKVDLFVHLLMSFAGATLITLLAAVYLWWSS